MAYKFSIIFYLLATLENLERNKLYLTLVINTPIIYLSINPSTDIGTGYSFYK